MVVFHPFPPRVPGRCMNNEGWVRDARVHVHLELLYKEKRLQLVEPPLTLCWLVYNPIVHYGYLPTINIHKPYS